MHRNIWYLIFHRENALSAIHALMVISGHFNHVSLHKTAPIFTQFVNLMHLLYLYKLLMTKQPVTVRAMRGWSKGASAALQDCLQIKPWKTLCKLHSKDIDSLRDLCVDIIVLLKSVCRFPSIKKLVTKDIKALLKEKRNAFSWSDRAEDGTEAAVHEGKKRGRTDSGASSAAEQHQASVESMTIIPGFKLSSQGTSGDLGKANET